MLKNKDELILNVKQNTNGKWGFVIELGTDPFTGKRKQKTSFKYKSKKLATIAGNEFIESFDKKFLSSEKRTDLTIKNTIEDAFNAFLKEYSKKNIKPSTIKHRKDSFRQLDDCIKNMQIKNFSFDLIKSYLDSLYSKYKINTIDSIRVLLLLINEYLFDVNLVNEVFVRKIKIENRRQIYADTKYNSSIDDKYLTKEELETFLNYAKIMLPFRMYVAFNLIAHTGMRIGELSALKWGDFDGTNIYIYKTFFSESGRNNDYELLTTKSTAGQRAIPISKTVINLLNQWKQEQDAEKENAAEWLNEDFMFTNTRGKGVPYLVRMYEYHFQRLSNYLNENNIINKKIHPHTLRHTHVSLLSEAGVTLSQIKARVGHGDGNITENIYLHVTKKSQENSLELYEKLF